MIWKDRIKQYPHRYTLTNVSGTTYDFAEVTGEVNEVGTPVSAENMNKLLQRDGDDLKDTVTTFSEAGTRANIATGETTATIFGKTKKYFSDMQNICFTGDYKDLINKPFDKIITTQAEFEALLASPTWLGAQSVAFVGQFTLSTANGGVKIPADVKQIHGFNSAKITITNFVYNSSTAIGGLWYATAPTTNDYSIRDLEVRCTGTSGLGFRNCINLSNCTAVGTGTNGNGFGFTECNNLSNCTGTGTGTVSGYGFRDINYAVNCKDGGSSTAMWTGTNKNIVIDDSTAQTISAIKTFSVSPLVPTTPSGASAAVAKAYVDSLRTVYDKVIRTQAEFNAMIADSTWFGAKSVALVGQFTLSTTDNSGVKIPATVKQIHGFNSAKITITNFKYDVDTAIGGLWYDTPPATKDYSIRDLEVDCTGINGYNGYGFYNCINLSNCTGTGTGTNRNGYGFYNCINLSNCTGTGTGSETNGYGFFNINYAVNCKDGGSSTNMWGGTNKNIDLDTCRKTLVTAANTALNA